jgi:hypothetical protein
MRRSTGEGGFARARALVRIEGERLGLAQAIDLDLGVDVRIRRDNPVVAAVVVDLIAVVVAADELGASGRLGASALPEGEAIALGRG